MLKDLGTLGVVRALVPLGLAALLACGADPAESTDSGDAAADVDTASDALGDATSDTGADTGPPPVTFCEGATAYMYDPLGTVLATFPDDWLTRPDPSTPSATASVP